LLPLPGFDYNLATIDGSRRSALIPDTHLSSLDRSRPCESEHQLALRHAPCIRFDESEPFLPTAVGYTVLRHNAPSPSYPRQIKLPVGADSAIEYAIWWDWNSEGLCQLRYIWIYPGRDGQVISTETDWHDGYHAMIAPDGRPPTENGRVTLYATPGRHDFVPATERLIEHEQNRAYTCDIHAGKMGKPVSRLLPDTIAVHRPLNSQLARTYLERFAFEPSFEFSTIFSLDQAVFVPWDNLFRWIPGRVAWWTETLERLIPPNERRVLRIAHRGASAYAQEGSMTSLRNAAELGADMVEIDIRFTADHTPIVAHDADLQRVFDVPGQISELTLDELQRLTPPDREPLLSFDEMAAVCRGLKLGLYLDIKEVNPAAFESITATLKDQGMLNCTVFGSFRPDFLAEIKAGLPDAVTSILFSSTHIDPVALARSVGADFVHPCWERFERPHEFLTPEWLSRVRAADLGVICWHEERPTVISALQALGVYAICSDMPELLMP
jgi:glycerophosphoryl diester phosphodiesterase